MRKRKKRYDKKDRVTNLVSVVDINNAQARVRQVQALAGLSNG